MFPPCTATRVWISQGEYDRLREAEQRLREMDAQLARLRNATKPTPKVIQEAYTPQIPQPTYIQPSQVIDCATGKPYVKRPGKKPPQLAPYGVRPATNRPQIFAIDEPEPEPGDAALEWLRSIAVERKPIEDTQPVNIAKKQGPDWERAVVAAFQAVEGRGKCTNQKS